MGKILEKLKILKVLASDGAWGTLLHAKGLKPGECPESWNIDHPAEIMDIAAQYINAGADMTETNSFGGNLFKLSHYGLEKKVTEINRRAAELSRNAAGTEKIVLRNNIFLGFADFLQPYENTCLTYQETFPTDPFDVDYSVASGIKNGACPAGSHNLCQSPLLAGMAVDAFDPTPLSNSPAIDAGTNLPEVGRDIDGRSRPLDGQNDGTNRWDIGAVEYVHPLADSDPRAGGHVIEDAAQEK